MLSAVLALLVVAAPVQKVDLTKIESPKIDGPVLPDIPKVDGLSGPTRSEELQVKQTTSDLRIVTGKPGSTKVESVIHAHDFSLTRSGRKPVNRIDGFSVGGLPAKIGPFKTCVKLSTTDDVPVTLKVSLKSPSGNELLSSRADVAFDGAASVEVVIDWDGFQASQLGEYKLVVMMDGRAAGEFPVLVQGR
jgi:hypothetical protein